MRTMTIHFTCGNLKKFNTTQPQNILVLEIKELLTKELYYGEETDDSAAAHRSEAKPQRTTFLNRLELS